MDTDCKTQFQNNEMTINSCIDREASFLTTLQGLEAIILFIFLTIW